MASLTWLVLPATGFWLSCHMCAHLFCFVLSLSFSASELRHFTCDVDLSFFSGNLFCALSCTPRHRSFWPPPPPLPLLLLSCDTLVHCAYYLPSLLLLLLTFSESHARYRTFATSLSPLFPLIYPPHFTLLFPYPSPLSLSFPLSFSSALKLKFFYY